MSGYARLCVALVTAARDFETQAHSYVVQVTAKSHLGRDTQCKGRTRCPQTQPHSPTQLFVPMEQNSTATFALTSARRRKAHPTFCSKWNAIILILICNACRETAVMRRTRGWRWPLSADARS